MRVFHLLGQSEDHGGILSVIRGLQQATEGAGVEHVVWVRQGYEERRGPSLNYRVTRHLVSDSPSHWELLVGAWRSRVELDALRRAEAFDVLHAHSRGGFLLAWWLAAAGKENVLFTNHSFARRTWMYRAAARSGHFYSVVLTPSMRRHYQLDGGRVRTIPACVADSFFEGSLVTRPGRSRAGFDWWVWVML